MVTSLSYGSWVDDGTDHATIRSATSDTPTAELVTTSINEEAGVIRTRTKLLHDDVDALHKRTKTAEWNERTAREGRKGVPSLLQELADLGFAWRDVARMVGVSVPAIRKWRKGDGATPTNRRQLASLLAACQQTMDDYHVEDVASWFEMPIHGDAPVTPIDLWLAARVDLVLEHASGHSDSETVLTNWDPDWRENYRTDFESFVAADGNVSIRLKS